jgi:cystathionine beta-lyase/cystathionine gamma-synthase
VFAFDSLDEATATFQGRRDGFIYGRYGHPTGVEVEARLASLEGAEASAVTSSGMAAISLTFWTLCRQGDHVIASSEQYGGTNELLKRIAPAAGVDVSFVPLDALGDLASHVRERTRWVLVESPTNPFMHVVDFEALFRGLGRHGPAGGTGAARPVVAIDGTLGTPIGQDALGAGFDLVLHSATKYLGGHDDLTAGVVSGRKALVDAVRDQRRIQGANVDAQTAWLLERGVRTLAVRWERQCANALELARRLEGHAAVERVHYPGLPSHPQHAVARRQMRTFGAVLAFEMRGGLDAARRAFDLLEMVARAPSLGGVESMILHPATSSHRTLTPEERSALGITDGLLRLSVGIEGVEDLWRDLEQAMG